MRNLVTALLVLVAAGCATPAPESFTAGTTSATATHSTAIGANTVGEACTQQNGAAGQTDIYCGNWAEPSGHVRAAGPVDAGTLAQLAGSSPWRLALNDRFVCSDPTAATILGGQPAVVMQCTRRIGGWPYVAFVSAVQGQGWYADGVAAAFPAMERSVAVLSGQTRGNETAAMSGADALLAQRLAARAVRSGDIGQYDELMAAGTRANLADSPVAAEQAFRAALAVQEKALGVGNPNTAAPMMHLALQLSNQQRYPEADALFDRAGTLVRNAADPAAPARLLHYRGLDALNRGKPDEALALLKRAEAAYTELVPSSAMHAASEAAETPVRLANLAVLVPDQSLLTDPVVQSALLGIIECRRNEAIGLHMQDKNADSEAMLASADDLARANALAQPIVTSRIYRTGAAIEQANGHTGRALSDLSRSSVAFTRALPGSKSVAETALLHAQQLVRVGRTEAALPYCAEGVTLLRELLTGVDAATVFPCLDAYAAEAKRQPGREQALLGEMFLAAQLAQSSITSQQIAEASARLLEGGRDPHAADAIRAQQDTTANLADLYRQLDEAAHPGLGGIAGASRADLKKQIAEAQTAVADADTALQAASPNYGQLVQRVVPAADVFAALHPGEALSTITIGDAGGWSFLLRDGHIAVQLIDGGEPRVAKLVQRIRASMDIETAAPPAFDTAAAAELYTALYGGFAAPLDGVTALAVAPTGPLLSIPFGLLLTGPASPDALPTAPWLIRRVTVAHVPAAANFVSLRRLAVTARAPRAWFGFGDFRPVTLAQAEHSFPPASCGDTARLLAGLPPLPGAILELDSARKLLGASGSDEMLGPAFTAAAVRHAPLKEYRVLHFATHAVLPTDLRCQNDAAIVTSAPNGAADASGALLAASTVTAMDLNADTILLSACNTGGPNGAAGESLSGLARSFFYAGARSLLITHWAVNDRMSAYLVALTLAGYQASGDGSLEASLATAQRRVLDDAKEGDASLAHPFYWAPLALIGEGGGATRRVSGL